MYVPSLESALILSSWQRCLTHTHTHPHTHTPDVPGVQGIEGRVARLASAALAQQAMSSGPAVLTPFDGPHRTALETTWQ
jgi:transcriptional regulator of acetoin/glycerol metabolism